MGTTIIVITYNSRTHVRHIQINYCDRSSFKNAYAQPFMMVCNEMSL